MNTQLVWGLWATAACMEAAVADGDITVDPPFPPIKTTRTPRPTPSSTPAPTSPPPQPTSTASPSTSLAPQPTTSTLPTDPPAPSSNEPTPSPSASPPSSSMKPSITPIFGAPSPSRPSAVSTPSTSTSAPSTSSTVEPTSSPIVPDIVETTTATPGVMVGVSPAQQSPAPASTAIPPALASSDTTSSLGLVLGVVVGICVVVGVVVVLFVFRCRRQASRHRKTIGQELSPPVTRGGNNGQADWDYSPHQHIAFVDAVHTKRGPHVALFSPGSTCGSESLDPAGKSAPGYVTSVGPNGLVVVAPHGKAARDAAPSQECVALEPPRRLNIAVATTGAPQDVITLGHPHRERIDVQQVMSSPASSTQTTFSL